MLIKVSQSLAIQMLFISRASQNLEQGCLVNGSVGKVVGFMTTHEAMHCGIKVGFAGKPDDSRSRAGLLDISGPKILDKILHSSTRWPVVNFKSASYPDGAEDVLCVPNAFEVNNAEGGIEAIREQVRTVEIG